MPSPAIVLILKDTISLSGRLSKRSTHGLLPMLAVALMVMPAVASDALRNEVVDAWQANQAKLGAVKLHVTEVVQDHTVSETKVERYPMPDGGETIITRAPQTRRSFRVTLFNDQILTDETANRVSRQRFYDGEKWHEHRHDNNTVVIRRTDQMPGIFPLDPRQLFMPEVRKPFLEVANAATFDQDADSSDEKRLIQMSVTNGNKLTVTFDPAQGMLPISSTLFHADGSVLRQVELHYDRVENRDAFLVSSVTARFFDAGDATPFTLASASPKTTVTTTVDRVSLLPSPEDGLLSMKVPQGTKVIDLSTRN